MIPLKLSAQNEQAWHAASRVQDVEGEAVGGVEHGVVDDQLATSPEQLGQGPLPARPLEHVGLRDRFPGEPTSLLAQLVAEPRELLLSSEERRPRRKPLFM